MVRFVSLALAVFIAGADASAKNLRAPGIFQGESRSLSYEFIAGYRPDSSVTDHNAIDLDQAVIETQVAKKTESAFDIAKAVYENGGHSKSYVKLTLTDGSNPTEADGTIFSGTDNNGQEVTGKVYKSDDTPPGELWLQYSTTDVQASYVGCQVGALALSGDANTDGCLQETGTVTSGDKTYAYEHVNLEDTKNGRTIKGFSTAVQKKMLDCANCPYVDAAYFYNYYGIPAYGDMWVTAAFDGTATKFPSGRGNADFSSYSLTGRAECAKKGTAYINIFMYVIREFEDALDDCKSNCINCNDDPVHAWDEGVAFYAGSLEGEDGIPSGKLLHQLADKRCANFDTCTDLEKTKSKVNSELLNLFNVGQGQLQAGKCEEARITKDKVADIMYIPLIQGTLRYAYKVDKLSGAEKEKAEGAVFAAAVLPRIYAADQEAAGTIYDNMRVGASSTDHEDVKKAFEKTYDALNIKCSDVGGLLDKTGNAYYEGMEPCKDKSSGVGKGGIVGIVFGSAASAIALGAFGYIIYMRKRERSGNPVFKANDKPAEYS